MADVIVRVKGEDQASGVLQKFGGVLSNVFQTASGFLAAQVFARLGSEIINFAKGSIEAASNLGETINKTSEIFGDSAEGILKWAKSSATTVGLAEAAALDAASGMAIFGKAAGLAGDDLNKFATDNVQQAADMASFFNTSVEDASMALQAAFRGESEPIRRYGVLLNDTTMREKAFELGIVSTTKKALTPQQKVLAANALIHEQLADAQGDFARTSDGLANSQRILAAQMENVKTSLGEAFLPLVTQAVGWFSREGIPIIQGGVDAFKKFADMFNVMIDPNNNPLQNALLGISNVLYGLRLDALGDLVAGLSEGFGGGAATGLFNGLKMSVASVRDAVMGFLQTMGAWWDVHGETIVAAAQRIGSALMEFFGVVARDIGPLFQSVLEQISGWFIANGPLIEEFVTAVAGFFQNNLLPAALSLWDGIKVLVGGIVDLLGGLITFVMNVLTGNWSDAWEGLKATLSNAALAIDIIIGNLIDGIAHIFGSSYNEIYSWGQGIVDGIKKGLQDGWASVKEWFSNAIDDIKSVFTFAWDLHSPSGVAEEWGQNITGGLLGGLKKGFPAVQNVMNSLNPGGLGTGGIAGGGTGTMVNIYIQSPMTFMDEQNAVENIRTYVVQAFRQIQSEGLV